MDSKKAQTIHNYEGFISAPFTAFKPNGELNNDIYPQYVDHLVSQGVKGVFVNGTTGEGLSLTVAERKAVAEGWVKAGKNKLEVIIIQIAANSIKDAQELAAHAEKIGVTGIAALPPLFYKPQKHDHLIAYFKSISDAAPSLPIMLYHIPSYSSVEITLSEFMPAVRKVVPNFIGAKFTSTEVRDLLRCHTQTGQPFKILSGFDEVLLPCTACGVTASVGASYNFMAPISKRMLDAYKKGNLEEARKMEGKILNGILAITKHGQGISCFKAAMNILTPLDFGKPRIPLLPLNDEALDNLRKDIERLKVEEWGKI